MTSVNFVRIFVFLAGVLESSANHFCSWTLNGEPKYFSCQRNEVCCHFGCCPHIAFQFYQLWYYWLLLIFLFMLCSGGSWWYKFCRQNESTNYPSASALPPNLESRSMYYSSVSRRRERRAGRSLHGHHSQSLHAQRLWKANTPPPNYYRAAVVRYHSATQLEGRGAQNYSVNTPEDCPYYQLYGPPPSYESVVRMETRNRAPSCSLVPSNMLITSMTAASGSGVAAGSSMAPVVILSPGDGDASDQPRIFTNALDEVTSEPVPSTSQQASRHTFQAQEGDNCSINSFYSDSGLDLPSLHQSQEAAQGQDSDEDDDGVTTDDGVQKQPAKADSDEESDCEFDEEPKSVVVIPSSL